MQTQNTSLKIIIPCITIFTLGGQQYRPPTCLYSTVCSLCSLALQGITSQPYVQKQWLKHMQTQKTSYKIIIPCITIFTLGGQQYRPPTCLYSTVCSLCSLALQGITSQPYVQKQWLKHMQTQKTS